MYEPNWNLSRAQMLEVVHRSLHHESIKLHCSNILWQMYHQVYCDLHEHAFWYLLFPDTLEWCWIQVVYSMWHAAKGERGNNPNNPLFNRLLASLHGHLPLIDLRLKHQIQKHRKHFVLHPYVVYTAQQPCDVKLVNNLGPLPSFYYNYHFKVFEVSWILTHSGRIQWHNMYETEK